MHATHSLFNSRRPLIAIVFAFALFSMLCVADCMRESDQASLLTGAWQLYKRHPIIGEPYYNYDKLYETYWLTAFGFWIRSHFQGSWSPILVGNLASASAFWLTTVAAVGLLAKRCRSTDVLALVCYLSTPAILLNSLYANPAIVSAGFLLLSGVLIIRSHGWLGRSLGAVFFFLAVGARGDAVLLAPLFVWLQVPRRKWFTQVIIGPTTLLLTGAIVVATWLGLILYKGKPLYLDPGFLGTKAFVGYVVFGLAASAFALLLMLAVLLRRMVIAPSFRDALFYLTGVLTLILPLSYYSVQLWSPRYLVTTALGVFLFSVSRRGHALLNAGSMKSVVFPMRVSIGVAAILTLLVGVRLPSPTRPILTLSQPTLFPTGDGLHPMGASANFMLKMRDAAEHEVDHNQVVWKAAREADYVPDVDGFVHVLDTPMQAYLTLAATLKGQHPKKEDVENNYDLRGQLYAETRTFMRIGFDQTNNALARLLHQRARIVSPIYHGVAVLSFTSAGDVSWSARTGILDTLFAGNEYRLYDPSGFKQYSAADDRPFALVADNPFEIAVNGRAAQADLDRRSGYYYLRGDTSRLAKCQFPSDAAGHLTLAVQVLPAWMSVNNR